MSKTLCYSTVDSPIGELLLVGDGNALHRLDIRDGRRPVALDPAWKRNDDPFIAVSAQLREYFDATRQEFDVELALAGNPFERRVWDALREIPFGATASYGAIARQIGSPAAARAVGLANGRNPIAVIVPCHRVIGAARRPDRLWGRPGAQAPAARPRSGQARAPERFVRARAG